MTPRLDDWIAGLGLALIALAVLWGAALLEWGPR